MPRLSFFHVSALMALHAAVHGAWEFAGILRLPRANNQLQESFPVAIWSILLPQMHGKSDGDIGCCACLLQDMLQDSTIAGGVHPMMRLIADAAPQKGEIAMRSGQVAEVRPFIASPTCLHMDWRALGNVTVVLQSVVKDASALLCHDSLV